MGLSYLKKLILSEHVYTYMNNEELMLLAQQDNIEAFELLYERLKNPLFSYIRNNVHNENDAIDIAQEVFIKIYKNRKMYRSEYKVSTWIWRIARNTTIDHLRKNDPLKWPVYNDEAKDKVIDTLPNSDLPLDEIVNLRIEQEILNKCFNKLNENYKEAINLSVFGDHSYEEMAELMGKTISSIKALINKGKRSLKICIEKSMEQK